MRYVILPSCSEGQATSVLTVMCNGLIPFITKYYGIDIQDFTFQINNLNSKGITSAIDRLKGLSPDECRELAKKCLNYTRRWHSIQAYKQKLMQNLSKIL